MLLKKALKIFWGIIVALLALLFACWILLQTPAVQTFVARKAVAALGDALNGRIEFSKVHLKPFTALVLKDVTILDNEPVVDWDGERVDTVARAGSIVAKKGSASATVCSSWPKTTGAATSDDFSRNLLKRKKRNLFQ